MEITDFPTDTTNEYSTLKRLLVNAINGAQENTAKTNWLENLCTLAAIQAGNGDVTQTNEWLQDTTSNAYPAVRSVFTAALSKNAVKNAADWPKLVAIFDVCTQELGGGV